MTKIVNGVANDFEFDMPNVSYSKAYTEQLLSEKDKEIERLNKFVDDILNFYKHNRYEEELTEDNMFKLVLNQNEIIMTIEEFKEGKKWK